MGTKWAVLAAAGFAMAAIGPAGWPVGPAAAAAGQAQANDPAPADEDDENLRQMMVLSIGRDSASSYADRMGLDDLQRELAMELYREYYEQYRGVAVTTRDVMLTARDAAGGDREEMMERTRDRMRVVLAFLDRAVELGEQYVSDLGALALDDAQHEGHRGVVRARQRELAVSLVGVDGGPGAVDLVRIARGLEPPLRPGEGAGPAGEALLAYERELERVCAPFASQTIDRYRQQLRTFMEGEADGELENEMQDAIVEMAATLNAAADRHAGVVRRALPEERQGEWDLAYKRARWPGVYAPGGVHRTHDAAMALDDLTGEQREAIGAAMTQYTREAGVVNTRWVEAMGEASAIRIAMRRDWDEQRWADLQEKEQATEDAKADRQALDERFAERMMQVLTPEQQEAMPSVDGGEIDVDAVMRELGGG